MNHNSSHVQSPSLKIIFSAEKSKSMGLYFLVIPIGFEALAESELLGWVSSMALIWNTRARVQDLSRVKGGLEFSFDNELAPLLNSCLKIPSRLLQRISVFSTRDKGLFQKQMKSIPWGRFFSSGISQWEIAASESKLNNEKHLRDWIEKDLQGSFYKKNEELGLRAYLRNHNNVVTVSRDLSGEHLHFRGYRKEQGEAPLRENLAAGLWAFLFQTLSPRVLGDYEIIDPFVGGGTILCEGWLWNRRVKTREYPVKTFTDKDGHLAVQKWESHLKCYQWRMRGVDLDPDVIEKAKRNLQNLQRNDNWDIDWRVMDSTDPRIQSLAQGPQIGETSQKPILVITNPPYGGKGRLKSAISWREIWTQMLTTYQPQWALGLGPEREARKGDRIGSWECVDTLRFLNGGLRVAASIWKKTKLNLLQKTKS